MTLKAEEVSKVLKPCVPHTISITKMKMKSTPSIEYELTDCELLNQLTEHVPNLFSHWCQRKDLNTFTLK